MLSISLLAHNLGFSLFKFSRTLFFRISLRLRWMYLLLKYCNILQLKEILFTSLLYIFYVYTWALDVLDEDCCTVFLNVPYFFLFTICLYNPLRRIKRLQESRDTAILKPQDGGAIIIWLSCRGQTTITIHVSLPSLQWGIEDCYRMCYSQKLAEHRRNYFDLKFRFCSIIL